MQEAGASFLLQQLPFLALPLLVHLFGAIIGLTWLRRATIPAMLCVAGCGLSILTMLAQVGIQSALIQMRQNWSLEQHAQMMGAVAVGSSIFRAIGACLIIAAVFTGRPTESHAPTWPSASKPPLA